MLWFDRVECEEYGRDDCVPTVLHRRDHQVSGRIVVLG
jgi:hypothetical protein